jgi:hypothetical protein
MASFIGALPPGDDDAGPWQLATAGRLWTSTRLVGRARITGDMTTAQGWTVLGILAVFAATIVTLLLAQIRSLRGYMDVRFDAVDARFDHLDRDIRAVVNRVFRRDEP